MSGNEELACLSKYYEKNPSGRYSPLLFVIDSIPLNYTLQKVNAGYQLGKSQQKTNKSPSIHG